jgi:DNA modification methylase
MSNIIYEKYTKKIKVNDLIPYDKNPKMHPQEQVDKIKKSIQNFKYRGGIKITEENIIVIGHGRVEALKQLGHGDDEIQVEVIKDLSKHDIKAYRIADNKTAESEWDLDLLYGDITDIKTEVPEYDLTKTGYSMDELNKLLDQKNSEPDEKDDKTPEKRPEVDVKLGDIYKLGNHRLMCGDSTKKEDVEKLMSGQKADMVFTDPPYCLGKGYAGEDLEEKEFVEFHKAWLQNLFNCIFQDTPVYIWFGVNTLFAFEDILKQWLNARLLIWYRPDGHGSGGGDYFYNYDPVLYGSLSGEFKTKSYDGEARDVWVINKATQKEGGFEHPTAKPLGVCVAGIKGSSIVNNRIIDLFGGSGSTLIACEKLNRKCYMMEIDPVYVDVIIRRWEEFTGLKSEKLI